uniref:BHLH domain-containing protein n=1 Tax=Aegilops tauschii subsp. strangulata TaxID=200361 RepID=A0A453APL8_AEGTS
NCRDNQRDGIMSRERKKAAALQEKMQILRSITHSHALSNPSIVMDASEYIKGLKQKIARLNQEIAREEDTHSHKQNSFPTVCARTHLSPHCVCILYGGPELSGSEA